jgi:PAS domain S-box-containing protein
MVARISQEMVSGRQPRNFNINRNYRKDGSIIHCEWYNSAIYNREGQLASVFSQVLDVTERKHAQTERDRFFELSIDIIAIAAAGEGRWKRVSPAFTQILGWSCEELLALPHIDELVHPDDLERSRQAYAGLLAGTPLVQFENRLRARDGTYRWFAWNTTPSIGDGLLYCVGRDITHRKANEEALKRAEAALREHAGKLEVLVNERTASLQETVDELERYSYSISHDMRAPLRAMNQYSQFLLEECEPLLPEEGRLYLRRISAASVRLDRLIQDVLTYHRVAQADMPLESVDLEALAREIVEGYPMIQPCGAEIYLVTPLLPVRGNLGALTQCLSNLLANAVKFTTPGVTPKVRIWTESHGAMVRVVVEDNGIGMEAGTLDRVWGIFQEVHETRNNAGTGIGLSIVKKAVQRMGGRVGLDSQPGNGSRFWFELRAAGNSAAS